MLVRFSSFNFSRQIERIFTVFVFSLTWLKKISFLRIIGFLLMLIGSSKTFWRFLKQTLHQIVRAGHQFIFYVLLLFQFLLIAILMVLQSILLKKTSILWRRGVVYDYCTTSFNKAWTRVLCRFKSSSWCIGDSRWWVSLTMFPAGNKAKCFSLVNNIIKTIHHHHFGLYKSSRFSYEVKIW